MAQPDPTTKNYLADTTGQAAPSLHAIPDRDRLLGLINAQWTTHAIAAAVRLGLPEAMAGEPASVDALAQACHAHAPSLLRLLRALATLGLCTKSTGGQFALTATGALLRANTPGSLNAWADLNSGRISTQWARLDESVRTGESIRKITVANDDFTHLNADAEAAALFNRAMVEITMPIAAALVRVVSFKNVQRVVDVGGGHGELLASVLRAYPALNGVLFDMAHATETAVGPLAAPGLADRCERVTGSFFDAVPAGADLYLLKSILHDWDDARSTAILRSCRCAMPPDSRLLIVERIAPDAVGTTPKNTAVARSDLLMMVANGGCERSESAYRALLGTAGLQWMHSEELIGGFSVMTAVSAETFS